MEKTALETQIGGSHYKSQAIQPVEYIHIELEKANETRT